MSQRTSISKTVEKRIDRMVEEYVNRWNDFETFRQQVLATLEDPRLSSLVHSTKSRLKEPDHLKDKLIRKAIYAKSNGNKFEIDNNNLFEKITDLVGIRILHLYTAQLEKMNPLLLEIFDKHRLDLVEGPFARTWDDESREYFDSINIETENSQTLYTSVHYVVGSASKLPLTCEIQVRTLSEEVWGEVDHELNYPHPTENIACAEQLKVLARVTSSTSRLVDAIFRTEQAGSSKERDSTH